MFFLLEHFSHEKKLSSVISDEITNLLYLCFEGGIVEVFRIEIKGILSILIYQKSLKKVSDIDLNTDLGIKNSIKGMFVHLKTLHISIQSQSFLRPLLKNYYNSFFDIHDIDWFNSFRDLS